VIGIKSGFLWELYQSQEVVQDTLKAEQNAAVLGVLFPHWHDFKHL